jgi:hypothetical protein
MKQQMQACTAVEVRKDRISPFAIALFLSAIALLVFVNRATPVHAAEPEAKPPTQAARHA